MYPITPLNITSMTVSSCLGHGIKEHVDALKNERSGLKVCDLQGANLEAYIGEVAGVNDVSLPSDLMSYDCRNNRLAYLCLQQDGFMESVDKAKDKYGDDRIGLFLGTSTSGVQQTEKAFAEKQANQDQLPEWFDYESTQSTFSVAEFSQKVLGLTGIAQVIATACSSSAKTFASAWRHIEKGYCDAAIVGGVDSLCLMTLYGFNSLQLVSTSPCKPADINRDGISVGEAAGYVLLERSNELEKTAVKVQLLGFGESSDGYHMSTPHPQGKGAILAMEQALERANCNKEDVDYINLHGTATPANDQSEDQAVSYLFPQTACSSTKGWTGHTLGAAGILEAVFAILSIQNNLILGSLNTLSLDPKLRSQIALKNKPQMVKKAMSNSFGFGGNNCSLLFGETE